MWYLTKIQNSVIPDQSPYYYNKYQKVESEEDAPGKIAC